MMVNFSFKKSYNFNNFNNVKYDHLWGSKGVVRSTIASSPSSTLPVSSASAAAREGATREFVRREAGFGETRSPGALPLGRAARRTRRVSPARASRATPEGVTGCRDVHAIARVPTPRSASASLEAPRFGASAGYLGCRFSSRFASRLARVFPSRMVEGRAHNDDGRYASHGRRHEDVHAVQAGVREQPDQLSPRQQLVHHVRAPRQRQRLRTRGGSAPPSPLASGEVENTGGGGTL